MSIFPRFLRREEDEYEVEPAGFDWDPGAPQRRPLQQRVPKRFLTTLTLVSLFFGGAAFVAGAGDMAAKMIQKEDTQAAPADASAAPDGSASADPSAADPSASDPSVSSGPTASSSDASASSSDAAAPSDAAASSDNPQASVDAAPAADSPAAAPEAQPDSSPEASGLSDNPRASHSAASGAPAHRTPVVLRGPAPRQAAQRVHVQLTAPKSPPDPEVRTPGVSATIWLNRVLPDPTPPAKRLTMRFAAQLAAASKKSGADWALVLGVLRAEGATGSSPATRATLARLSGRLVALEAGGRDKWEAAAAFVGNSATADRAVALGHYYRAVGLWALVHGLQAAKKPMAKRILNDPRITIYPGGREDLQRNRVNIRVITVVAYLAEEFGQVTVSCLVSGHRLYARPGVISAHVYGDAADIAALGGQSILGHQQPGSVTEKAVRDLLLLPPEMLPKQVISLIGLGGPSFPLPDHYNHIHVGY